MRLNSFRVRNNVFHISKRKSSDFHIIRIVCLDFSVFGCNENRWISILKRVAVTLFFLTSSSLSLFHLYDFPHFICRWLLCMCVCFLSSISFFLFNFFFLALIWKKCGASKNTNTDLWKIQSAVIVHHTNRYGKWCMIFKLDFHFAHHA